jgi:hypothetical protein
MCDSRNQRETIRTIDVDHVDVVLVLYGSWRRRFR